MKNNNLPITLTQNIITFFYHLLIFELLKHVKILDRLIDRKKIILHNKATAKQVIIHQFIQNN